MDREGTGESAVVMGLGRFGGGLGAAGYLLQQGMAVTVTDLQTEDQLQDSLIRLRKLPGANRITLVLGTHEGIDFENADLVVANPAIPRPWQNPFLKRAMGAGTRVCTEIQLLLERIDQSRLIAVTGSAGKSTTCAMIHHLLGQSGRSSLLGGNLGGSLLGCDQQRIDEADAVVLEVSSFMLHWIGTTGSPFRPGVGVLTNLGINHTDWHGDLDHYVSSKSVLCSATTPGNLVLPVVPDAVDSRLPGARDLIEGWSARREASWDGAGELGELHDSIRLNVPGEHQVHNAMTALRAVASLLADRAEDRRATALTLASDLATFTGLPHRLKVLEGFDGIRVVDDSKSTTPEATLMAVAAMDDRSRTHLIAGGFDKGGDLSGIDALGDDLAGLYAIGTTAGSLLSGRNAVGCGDIESAVASAAGRMRPGDTLLLSPGCASWDQFANYEERGRAFAAAARSRLGGHRDRT